MGNSEEADILTHWRIAVTTAWMLGCALALLALSGCGRSGPERVVVSGTVNYQGKPLRRGEIRFFPIQKTDTPMTGAYVVDGRYTADKRGGVPVGTHRVVIEAFRSKRKAGGPTGSPPDDLGAGLVPQEQYLPEQYNLKSDLQITLEPGAGSTVKDFNLTD